MEDGSYTMHMVSNQVFSEIENHIRDFFSGHEVAEFVWPLGPIQHVLSN